MAKSQKRTSREAKKPKADAKSSKSKTPAYQSGGILKEGTMQPAPQKKKG